MKEAVKEIGMTVLAAALLVIVCVVAVLLIQAAAATPVYDPGDCDRVNRGLC